MKLWGGVVVVALLCGAVAAGEGAQAAYDLSRVEGMGAFVGSDAAREHLARTGFVVTDHAFKQVFEAYISAPVPKFVTTDSAWHTYHVLLEEGVRKLEQGQASALSRFSAKLTEAALAKAGGNEGPYRDLARFAAVGLAFQDPEALRALDAGLADETRNLVGVLTEGAGPRKVLFFGLPFMPERLKAHSFYTGAPGLAAYFAARQWYALCDFRAKSEEETALAVRLALLIAEDAELSGLYSRLTGPYDRLLARAEDGDVAAYVAIAREVHGDDPGGADLAAGMEECRQRLALLPPPSVNDQYLIPEQYEDFGKETKGFRLLPPRRIPSAVLFQNTVDPLVKGRMFPSGLDVCAVGPLASEAGRRALRASLPDEASYEAVLKAKAAAVPDSLHGEALKLLALLQEPLPEAAPAPLRTDAWQDKQLWTQLGAWAEQRHTWALHTKLTEYYLMAVMGDPGFVSPYPEFFTQLGRLSRATASALATHDAGQSADVKALGGQLLDAVAFLEAMVRGQAEVGEEDAEKAIMLQGFAERVFAEDAPESPDQIMHGLNSLRRLGKKAAGGAQLNDEELGILAKLASSSGSVPALLGEFAELCDSLAEIARKELAREPLSAADEAVIHDYGTALARFHFYEGNSWLEPRDDFPLVTPVFANPLVGETLHVGLARPEALYVIVGNGDRAVLHRGVVLSYREFRRPSGEPLDDASWTAEVLRGSIPRPPSFTDSFRKVPTEDEVVRLILSGSGYAGVDSVPGRRITRAMIDQLLAGTHPRPDWLLTHLRNRAGAEDVGDLIRLLKTYPKEGDPDEYLDELTSCIVDLPCLAHREELHAILRGADESLADRAAHILRWQPESIDTGALAAEFESLPAHTKRLCVSLFGHAPSPGAEAASILLDALSAEDSGLRSEAARAVARAGLNTPAHCHALIKAVDDPDEYVAAAAVNALRALGARDAASPILARLQRTAPPDRDLNMSGSETRALAKELIAALGDFAHGPAADTLEDLLGGYCGLDALDALKAIDPGGHLDRLARLATNTAARSWVRHRALVQIAVSERSPDVARRLLPLLDDISSMGSKISGEDWQARDHAAMAIATILEWPDNITLYSDRQAKDALIARIKAWAAE